MTYKIINYYSSKTICFGNTKLNNFKTLKDAREMISWLHQKAIEDEEEVHCWLMLAIKK